MGRAVQRGMGGTSGALYAAMLLRAGAVLHSPDPALPQWARAVEVLIFHPLPFLHRLPLAPRLFPPFALLFPFLICSKCPVNLHVRLQRKVERSCVV
jgi:hypothetical protein